MNLPARRTNSRQLPRTLAVRKEQARGAADRAAIYEAGKNLAAQIEVVMAASTYAARCADNMIREVAEMGEESERSELAGGRFIKLACRTAEALIADTYGPLGGAG